METKSIIVIVLVALILITIVQAIEITNIRNRIIGSSITRASVSNSGSGDQTYDEMMAKMHPELYAQQSATSSRSTMVGGC